MSSPPARPPAQTLLLAVCAAAALVACPGTLEEPGRFRFQIGPIGGTSTGGVGGTSSGPGGVGPAGQAGTTGTGGRPPPPPLCPIDVVEEVLRPSCATFACHDAQGAAISGGLRFDVPDVAAELVGAPVGTTACADAGWTVRVDPDDPLGGGLMLHLLTSATPDCSKQMPSGSEPLPPYQLECVRRWLEHQVYQRGGEAP